MRKVSLLVGLLAMTGCNAADASSIDPSDDLHCGVVALTLKKSADNSGATSDVRKGLYVLHSWYFSKLKQDRISEALAVVDAMKADPSKVVPVAKACSDRAFSDPAFSRWSSFILKNYDQTSTR